METPLNLLESAARLQKALLEVGIESVVIGGIAVAVWGDARVTKDADLKVLLQREQAEHLLAVLPPNYRPKADPPHTPLETLRLKGFIYTYDEQDERTDLLLAETHFDHSAISRGKELELVPGVKLVVCSAEDLIVYKMISIRPRDQNDLPGIFRRQRKTLDHTYVQDWLRQFEIAFDDSTLVRSYRQMARLDS